MDLFDPLFLMGMATVVLLILILYMLFKRTKPGREVMYLRERDRRGQRLSITEETATTIFCRARKGIDKRFFKWGGSYVFNEGGKQVTRFFGKEGTAYTYKLKEGKIEEGEHTDIVDAEIKCPKCNEEFTYPVEVNNPNIKGEEVGTLKDALVTVCGKEFYETVPDEQKTKIEDGKVFVTVELEPGLTPEGYSSVSEEDINEDQDRNAARIFARSLAGSTKSELYKGLLWAAVGALLCFIAFNFHVFTAP